MKSLVENNRRAMIIKLFYLLLGGFIASHAWAAEQAAYLEYGEASRRLSVSVGAISAKELLTSLADTAGIRVRVRGDVGTVRAQSFSDLPLGQAIQRLFRSPDRSLVMLYEAAPDGGQRLAEVRLAARAAADAPRTPQAEAPELMAAAPPLAMLPPPPMHLRLPPPPPPPRRR
jgi:hypothetical protein